MSPLNDCEAHDNGIQEMHPLRRDIDIHLPWCTAQPALVALVRPGNFFFGIDILKLGGKLSGIERRRNELFVITVNSPEPWLHLYELPSLSVSIQDLNNGSYELKVNITASYARLEYPILLEPIF